jgi:hypothetical protein
MQKGAFKKRREREREREKGGREGRKEGGKEGRSNHTAVRQSWPGSPGCHWGEGAH